ncbi:hypothetical protein ACFOLF_28910 [Paenibacillus sepulcri]|uniref:Uncharacterized protein n=1 Tax=Paenibacillus sepulcri TaxID=359917 RepID=A0ABS7C937_9BACL|nr:hypothetical protein [Paenibacillus sepulcri]
MNEPTALKHYFDERLARRLADLIALQYASFPYLLMPVAFYVESMACRMRGFYWIAI